MKKQKLQTWKSMTKKIKVPCTGETVKMQKDRNLLARMMVICKSQPEIDVKEAVGTYEFRVVPRSIIAADKTMLYCPGTLRHILEKLPNSTNECRNVGQEKFLEQRMKVSVIDAMAEVQLLDKPEQICNCSHLADHFICCIFEKYGAVMRSD